MIFEGMWGAVMSLVIGIVVLGLVVLWARVEIRRQDREVMKTIREVRSRWNKSSCNLLKR